MWFVSFPPRPVDLGGQKEPSANWSGRPNGLKFRPWHFVKMKKKGNYLTLLLTVSCSFGLKARSSVSIRFTPVLSPCAQSINPLNAELNPICYFLALLGAHYFLHVSRIRVKSLTLRLLTSYIYIYIYIYIYGAPILDVSRSHTTTQHSR